MRRQKNGFNISAVKGGLEVLHGDQSRQSRFTVLIQGHAPMSFFAHNKATIAIIISIVALLWKTPAAVESLEAENLGTELEKGQRVSIGIPNSSECCLDKDSRRIGIRDTFGRIHWALTKDLKRVKREYAAGKQKPAGTASS
jgi:hypothetical protein